MSAPTTDHRPDSLIEDDGAYYRFTGIDLDRDAFDRYRHRVGRNNGPALLFDLYFGRTLDLCSPAMAGVVADVWSGAEYPERAFDDPGIWEILFACNGYSADGHRAERPGYPVTVYRGCTAAGRRGMSWTDDIATARRFAYDGLRGRNPGQVYVLTVPPEHLLAYIGESARGESEYVLDPRYIATADMRVYESADAKGGAA